MITRRTAASNRPQRASETPASLQPITSRWRVADPAPDGFYLEIENAAPRGSLALVSTLLYNRGIRNEAHALSFLNDGLDAMHPPSVIPGIKQAIDVILEAVRNGEGIGILGDFDADGITATAIIVLTLRKLGAEPKYHLPHREIEGHGISLEALERFHKQGVSVVITVDTGITAFDEVDYAKTLGIRTVITDHHLPQGGQLPNAAAIVNRHLSDDTRLADFCGAATAFKLAMALLAEAEQPPAPELIPLAAVGTLADQTELLGDNRIIVREGLKMLDTTSPPGLIELTRLISNQIRHGGPYDAEFITFQLAPRLNAPGRIDSADPSLKLLIATDIYQAMQLANYLDDANKKRRSIADKAWRAAKPKIDDAMGSGNNVMAIEVDATLPMGVLGPLAGNASEYSASPAFAYQIIDGVARASARSVPGFDIHQALDAVSAKLQRFGGHAAAAGFAADASLIPEITAHLETQMSWSALSATVNERAVRTADAEIRLDHLGYSMWDFIDKMAPFGTGNREPLFLVRGAETTNISYMGRNQDHVRLNLKDDTGRSFQTVGFRMADSLPPTRIVDAVVSLKTDYYRGNRRKELRLHDIAASDRSQR